MIETAGGMVPFLCHVFLILFGGFFGLNFALNKNFASKNNISNHKRLTDQVYSNHFESMLDSLIQVNSSQFV